MNFINQWLKTMFPPHRLTPTQRDVKNAQSLYGRVFSTLDGRALLELWLEQIMFNNPRTTEAGPCIKFTNDCAFIEDIVKAVDRAENPGKYELDAAQVPTARFEPRRVA